MRSSCASRSKIFTASAERMVVVVGGLVDACEGRGDHQRQLHLQRLHRHLRGEKLSFSALEPGAKFFAALKQAAFGRTLDYVHCLTALLFD